MTPLTRLLSQCSAGCLLIVAIGVVGCSNRQIYEGVRLNRMHECTKLSFPARDECLEHYGMTYEEYQRARDVSK